MKKHSLLPIIFVAVLVLALLSGCGNTSPVGKYYIKMIDGVPVEEYFISMQKQAGDETPLKEIYKELGIRSAEEYATIEVKKDGTLITSLAGVPAELQPSVGTWEQKDGKLLVKFESGAAVEVILNGKELTWPTDSGPEFVYVKK